MKLSEEAADIIRVSAGPEALGELPGKIAKLEDGLFGYDQRDAGMTETLPERMRKVALDLPVPDDLTNREYWLRTEILEWADEVVGISGRLLAYEQREAGYELCEAHEGHWHPIEEMQLTDDGVWLCKEAWEELVSEAMGG